MTIPLKDEHLTFLRHLAEREVKRRIVWKNEKELCDRILSEYVEIFTELALKCKSRTRAMQKFEQYLEHLKAVGRTKTNPDARNPGEFGY